jgi:hypothetical protein
MRPLRLWANVHRHQCDMGTIIKSCAPRVSSTKSIWDIMLFILIPST